MRSRPSPLQLHIPKVKGCDATKVQFIFQSRGQKNNLHGGELYFLCKFHHVFAEEAVSIH